MGETTVRTVLPLATAWAIALDGGTTNTRARLIQGSRIVATARREVGVRDSALGDRPGPTASAGGHVEAADRSRPTGLSLPEAVRDVIEEMAHRAGGDRPELIVAAGMLSSEFGLANVPHVPAPAGLAELAAAIAVRGIPEVSDRPIHFVPGVRTRAGDGDDGWMQADVMRGEECETIGALRELAGQGTLDPDASGLAFIWPGSHTKLVEVDRGKIVSSHTSLAGELLQAVARHTLLRASLPPDLPRILSPAAVAAGARAAGERGLARAAFLVRIAALEGSMSPEDRAGFWISAVVHDDSIALARHPILAKSNWIGVGGPEPLRSLYYQALTGQALTPVYRLDDETCERCSALGAVEIALVGRAGLSPR